MRRDINRNYHPQTSSKFLKFFVLFAVTILVAGCAGKSTKSSYKKIPTSTRRGDIMKPASAEEAGMSESPARFASMKLVENGNALLNQDQFDKAISKFRDAINVDSSNGVAYYCLALTHYYMNQPEIAAGMLEKAQTLLGYDEKWQNKIEQLRLELKSSIQNKKKTPENSYEEGQVF